MRKRAVNAEINGYLEIRKIAEGDEINLYLQPDSLTWYFLAYRDNILYMMSSDYNFNKYAHTKSKLSERKDKEFVFALTDYTEMEEFKQFYKEAYLGQSKDSVNYDSLDIVYNLMVESFVKTKVDDTEEEELEDFETDDGFEDITEEDLSADSTDSDAPIVDEEDSEEPEFDDYNNEDLEEEFENSSLTGEAEDKKKKKEKKKKEKKEPKSKDEETSEDEDDLKTPEDEDDSEEEDLGDDEDLEELDEDD